MFYYLLLYCIKSISLDTLNCLVHKQLELWHSSWRGDRYPYFHIERCYSDPLLLGVIKPPRSIAASAREGFGDELSGNVASVYWAMGEENMVIFLGGRENKWENDSEVSYLEVVELI
jgi:hypothetical protein